MSALMRGEWKEINREVERVLLDYPRDESAIPHTQWMFARAIRELGRRVADAQKDATRLDYMDDAQAAEDINAGDNDDGAWGYIRTVEGEHRWYPTLRRAIDDALNTTTAAHTTGAR